MGYHCDECGFTYVLDEHVEAAEHCRRLAREIAARLDDRRRPAPDVWSPLEYGCHVRDVLIAQRERVLLARRSAEPPAPEPMGRDERVDHDGYAEQEPVDVARQLVDAADLFANVLDRLDADAWGKQILYRYPPPPKHRPLRWVAVHTVHELTHHLRDIELQPSET